MGGYRPAMRSAGEGMRAAAPALRAPLAVPVLAAVRQPVPLQAATSLPTLSAVAAAALLWRLAPAPAVRLGPMFRRSRPGHRERIGSMPAWRHRRRWPALSCERFVSG